MCSPGVRDTGGPGRKSEPRDEAIETAAVERFVQLHTLRLIGLLYPEDKEVNSVAEERSPYTLSRPAAGAAAGETLEPPSIQGQVVAEIEGLVRQLAALVRRHARARGERCWSVTNPCQPMPEGGAQARPRALGLEGLEEVSRRLEQILPEERAAAQVRERLEGLIPELEMLLRPDSDTKEVLTFAFGQKAIAWVCGRAAEAQAMVARVEKLAPTDLPVLICGETGTGKELAARYVHARSRRAAGPFVAVNCAAIPTELLESHLFGQRAGAFTSAREKPGFLEAADGGTFFLDEISELSLDHQAKLLRFIEEREYIPVGGRKPKRADVRLLGATNRNLLEQVRQGGFRLDLYHRINDFVIQLPPLRERREDLPLFIDFFLRKCSLELGRPVRLTEEARAGLLSYDYPGNIRELEKTIRRACILCEDGLISPADLLLEEAPPPAAAAAGLAQVRGFLEGLRLARRSLVIPKVMAFLKSVGQEWFSSRDYARATGLSDSQARAQLKAMTAEGGPLEHNAAPKAASRYRLRRAE